MRVLRRHRRLALVISLSPFLVAAGCGSDGPSASDAVLVTNMEMGDAHAAPATEAGGKLRTGTFVLLETRPPGHDDARGTAAIARHDRGTTVTMSWFRLEPDLDYISHVHSGSCENAGAEHYRFDPDGAAVPPNEIHIAFTAAPDGSAPMTVENDSVAGPEAVTVVVHPTVLLDNRVACATFS